MDDLMSFSRFLAGVSLKAVLIGNLIILSIPLIAEFLEAIL